MAERKYIFRWNDGIEVTPSAAYTREDVWRFAIKWLRPAGMKDDKEAEDFIRRKGEVVRTKNA